MSVCTTNPTGFCLNGGSCVDNAATSAAPSYATCTCVGGYTNTYCQTAPSSAGRRRLAATTPLTGYSVTLFFQDPAKAALFSSDYVALQNGQTTTVGGTTGISPITAPVTANGVTKTTCPDGTTVATTTAQCPQPSGAAPPVVMSAAVALLSAVLCAFLE